MDPSAALKAFAAVFPAELPDKTMIATVVLVTRYQRPLPVWCGAAAADTPTLPDAVRLVGPSAPGASADGSGLPDGVAFPGPSAGPGGDALASGTGGEAVGAQTAGPAAGSGVPSVRAAVVGSFGVIVLAEWGDLTQFATAGMAASTGEPLMVAVGALLALWAVAALAASVGRQVAARLPIDLIQRAAAGVFAVLALSVLWSLRP